MAKTKSAPAEDVELEELDDDVEETTSKGGANAVTFGVADLCAYLEKKTGKKYKTRDIRTLIRKMAREDKPRVNREIIPGNRSRYDWPEGLNDPEVKRIIKAVTGGEVEEGKKEALAKLKENKAKKDAKAGKKSKKSKAAAPAPEPDDDDDLEDIEDDDE